MNSPRQLWGHAFKQAFFRHDLPLDKRPAQAILRIFVDTGFELFVNGHFVARADEWNNTRDYDVRLFLNAGNNLFAVHAINSGGHRGFAFQLDIDGKNALFSDDSWKTSDSERWGWFLPEFDDKDWQPPVVLPMHCAGEPQWKDAPGSHPELVLAPRPNTPFFRNEVPKFVDSPFFTKSPVTDTPDKDALYALGDDYARHFSFKPQPFIFPARIILSDISHGTLAVNGQDVTATAPEQRQGPVFCIDFGGECCGYFRMRVASEAVVRFRLVYGESLDECFNEPAPEELLHKMLIEEISLPPGTQEWESRMRVGFRFVAIEFLNCPKEVQANGFHIRSSLYPVQYQGFFSCSDEKLNAVWRAARKTLHLCMQEYYLDAVKRDRLLWVGDTRAEALFNYYAFADRDLVKFSLKSIADCQYPDGAIGSAWGCGASLIWDYVAWFVIAIHDYYLYTGDADFPLSLRSNLCAATDWLTSKMGENYLIDVPKNPLNTWFVVLDQSNGLDPYLNALHLRCLKTAKLFCELAHDYAKTAKYAAVIDHVEPAVSQLLAQVPLAKRTQLLGQSTGFLEVMSALFAEDKAEEAFNCMCSRWSMLLSCGADTLYEGMTSDMPDIAERHPELRCSHVSFCHGWTASPLYLLPAFIAGIRPVTPGFSEFTVEPHPCTLKVIKCVVPTPHGNIIYAFDNGITTLIVPPGTTAHFKSGNTTSTFTSGRHFF